MTLIPEPVYVAFLEAETGNPSLAESTSHDVLLLVAIWRKFPYEVGVTVIGVVIVEEALPVEDITGNATHNVFLPTDGELLLITNSPGKAEAMVLVCGWLKGIRAVERISDKLLVKGDT